MVYVLIKSLAVGRKSRDCSVRRDREVGIEILSLNFSD